MDDSPSMLCKLLRNPIILKDLRTNARSSRFFVFIISFVIASCIALLIGLRLLESQVGLKLFATIFAVQSVLIIIAAPAFAGTAIASERRDNTLNLLCVTALQPWEIAWGKFAAVMANLLVFALSTLPLVALCAFYRGLGPMLVACACIYLLLATATTISFCLMISAMVRSPIEAILISYIISPVFLAPGLLGAWGAISMNRFPIELGPVVIAAVAYVSLGSLFYVATVCRLKPPSWNRSTALRIWLVSFEIVWLACLVPLKIPAQFFLVVICVIPAVIAAVGFCAEPAELSEHTHNRLARFWERFRGRRQATLPKGVSVVEFLPTHLALFVPGKLTAGGFVKTTFITTVSVGSFLLAIADDDVPGIAAPFLTLLVLLASYPFVRFCCILSSTASLFGRPGHSRLLTIAILAGLSILPLVFALPGMPLMLCGISPIGNIVFRTRAGTLDAFLMFCVHVGFYLTAARLIKSAADRREEHLWLYGRRRTDDRVSNS